jgi:uncharacterized damage-inducible protein DinB
MQILQKQYLLTQAAREAMLTFVERAVGDKITSPIPALTNKSIRDLLVHSAAVYLHWIDHFVFRQPKPVIEEEDFGNMRDIRNLYKQADERMNAFFLRYENNLEERIIGDPGEWDLLGATALEVFTHVITHEFHHKGQVLLMCRHLGHVPPDTDVSIAFNET